MTVELALVTARFLGRCARNVSIGRRTASFCAALAAAWGQKGLASSTASHEGAAGSPFLVSEGAGAHAHKVESRTDDSG